MYESSSSQVFRTTTEIQSGPDHFDESRPVMTFLIILWVIEILCCFSRLILNRKTGKQVPESSRLEFLEKFLGNNFALTDLEYNTSGQLNRGGTVLINIAGIPLTRTMLAICKKQFLGRGLLISMLEKFNWFYLMSLITLVLLTWRWMGLFLRKNHLLRCWGWLSF